MYSNYHSHTKWCRHGKGEIEEYIKEAINNGIKIYGISEHIPYKNHYSSRIEYEELEEFMKELEFYKEKYKDKITILKALECEYFEQYHDYYLELKEKYNLDYLILGQHFKGIKQIEGENKLYGDFFFNKTHEELEDYKNALIKGVNSGLFLIIAHPDVYLNDFPFDKKAQQIANEIFKICENSNVILEINVNGFRNKRGYPNWSFWEESKNYNLKYVVNSDCHFLEHVYDQSVKDVYKKLDDMNIEVLDKIDL